MIWAVMVCALMLTVGAVLAVIRAAKGPSMLDRAIALDVIASTLVIAVAVEAAWNQRVDSIHVIAALALVAFLGSVAFARFTSVEPEDAGRILTPEEALAEDAARLAVEEEAARLEAQAAALRDEDAT